VIGFGTVGQWLVRALASNGERFAAQYGFRPVVVGAANARSGLIYRSAGLDVQTLLSLASNGRSLGEHGGASRWPGALDGLRHVDADILVEATSSPAVDAQPGYNHIREALHRDMAVVTSNKWPVALHGVELMQLARARGVAFRAEATVMSGTPVLSTLLEGLGGARPIAIRGILNATSNFIVSQMLRGVTYAEALATAQQTGLAERDPTADVEGYDAVAKLMILAGLVFRRQLRIDQVVRRGITDLDMSELDAAKLAGAYVRPLATLQFAEPDGRGDVFARVGPATLGSTDPLAGVDGVHCAIQADADPVGTVTIVGPGAGVALAGQGVLADIIAIARQR
jgi:homoserine dehydrogenase